MRISYLLNPFCGENESRCHALESPPIAPCTVITTSGLRRPKVPKDAPIFSEGNKTVGAVNFPPYEARNDQNLLAQHRDFKIYPLGEIYKKGVRHIPYNSDKKDFLDKTGRDAFEMFQYTYKRPGEDKDYVVVWDYNVGLVRMTPFFKSCKYSKTIPAKALRENPELKDISYSITGGALVCQGYWFPYHAARAVAATFCYDIRWALTPVFGNDFPSICLHPKDPSFAKFVIDPAIVQYCARETNRFRAEGLSYRILGSNSSSEFEPQKTHFIPSSYSASGLNEQRGRPTDIESGYGTDTDRSDRYFCSPQVSPRSQFTPVNRSLSPTSPHILSSSSLNSPVSIRCHRALPAATSVPVEYGEGTFRTKRTHSKVAFNDHCDDDYAVRPQTAATINSCYSGRTTGGFGGDDSHTRIDFDAAEMLLSLSVVDDTQPPSKRTRRGLER